MTFTTQTPFHSTESARSEPSVPLGHDSLLDPETEKWNVGPAQVFTESSIPYAPTHRHSMVSVTPLHI